VTCAEIASRWEGVTPWAWDGQRLIASGGPVVLEPISVESPRRVHRGQVLVAAADAARIAAAPADIAALLAELDRAGAELEAFRRKSQERNRRRLAVEQAESAQRHGAWRRWVDFNRRKRAEREAQLARG
jgi:hypothetical protein